MTDSDLSRRGVGVWGRSPAPKPPPLSADCKVKAVIIHRCLKETAVEPGGEYAMGGAEWRPVRRGRECMRRCVSGGPVGGGAARPPPAAWDRCLPGARHAEPRRGAGAG